MLNRDVKQMNLNQLRQRLREKGLKTKGRKRDLIKRLQDSEVDDMDNLKNRPVSDARQRSKLGDTNGLLGTEKAASSTSVNPSDQMIEMLQHERQYREGIVLWRRPLTTLQYFAIETFYLITEGGQRLWKRKKLVISFLLVLMVLSLVYNTEGSHQQIISVLKKNFLWWSYWVGLGILSSVGLGTGLHTFLLYLGPHIAAVTLAAYECNSVDFPEPPYPNEIVCPEGDTENNVITLWTIMNKVRLEAVMWGAGTAIGELPPYFMARAARLSGADLDSDDFEEIEELIHEKKTHPDDMGFMERAKLGVHNLVQRVGFFGILACASIPNPLFDLAGITCGHFLVPFWTFFGATLIGKAIVKMHIQKVFVIFLFSVHHVEKLIELIGMIPVYGESAQTPFKEYLEAQKKKLHHKPGSAVASESNLLGWIFEKVVIVMVAYFILSIINSTAQSYHKRLCKEKHKKAQH